MIRILQIREKNWRIEIGAPLLAILNLSSVNLPDGELRRKDEVDQLNMRTFLQEGDLTSVCFFADLSFYGSFLYRLKSTKFMNMGTLAYNPATLNMVGFSFILLFHFLLVHGSFKTEFLFKCHIRSSVDPVTFFIFYQKHLLFIFTLYDTAFL